MQPLEVLPLAQRVREEVAVGGNGGCREVTGILPDPVAGQDSGGGGALEEQH